MWSPGFLEDIGGFVPIAVLVAIGGAIFLIVQHVNAKRLNETFSRVAAHYGGVARPGGTFALASICFQHAGARVAVYHSSTGGKHKTWYTQVDASWPDHRFRMEVYPEGVFNRIGKFLGMQDIEIGSPGFDDDYMITGNRPGEIRDRLTPAAQAAVAHLRQRASQGDTYLRISGGELLVRSRGYLSEYHSLIGYIDDALELYDALLTDAEQGIEITRVAGGDGGIQFVDAAPAAEGATTNIAPICQICGEEIASARVVCKNCKTPHHEDCWKYYGACSTYGCGQTRFRKG